MCNISGKKERKKETHKKNQTQKLIGDAFDSKKIMEPFKWNP